MSNWKLMDDSITFMDRLKMAGFIMTADRLTNGERVRKFEDEWNDWLGSKYSLFVSSGSTANFLLIAAAKELYGLKSGDKVLLPACTWMTNVAPIIQLGLTPIFCDINLHNFSFDIEQMEEIAKIHPDIKMIFVTHLLGFAADNSTYRNIFPEAIILDDVCESHGTQDENGVKVGAHSLGATFSFYFGHHMTTIEGGMVSTKDPELYDIMKMKRSHGLARESVNFNWYADMYPNANKSFLFITDGYNFRNHEVCAVLGSSQLKRLSKNIDARRRNYEVFHKIISKHSDKFYVPELRSGDSSFSFPLVSYEKEMRFRLQEEFNKHGIESRPIVGGNLLSQPFLKEYEMAILNSNSKVSLLDSNGVYIGNSQFVTRKNLELLSTILDDIKL